jgi:arylsulfatase A
MRTIHSRLQVTLAVAVLATLGFAAPANAEAQRKPNILFILIDDLGWADVGCYGQKFNETTNIDRLRSQGMKFTSAYAACPVCSPTRASILTGKYPATLNLTDFIPGHLRPWAKLTVPQFNQRLPSEEVTLAEALKSAGYASASLGKWHLGGRDSYPKQHGFDKEFVTSGGHFGFRIYPPTEERREGEYLADRLTDEAIAFIEKNRDGPFFLYLAHYAVHIPLQAPKELIEKYEKKSGPAGRPNNPIYAAMVESADRSVGRLMKKLDDLGLADDTVVIFFSDNGGLIKRFDEKGPVVTSNAPLRAEKGTLYEGGIRVPLIVRWPGVVKPGSVCDVPVTSVDFYPTILQIAGVAGDPKHKVDGESLMPLLEQSGGLKRDAIYWHYPHYHHCAPCGAVRSDALKLIEYYEDGRHELYNLADDIGEQRNLADAQPKDAERLAKKLADWRRSVGAKMPTPNPNFKPAKAGEWGKRRRPAKKKQRK